ncbi:MAG TPA: 3-deoxy-D-manno-octulosonic acid transferase [Rhizomicrobium sp.]|jgi:3-deoxy-D-manno-octulosonic-acid transferase|nr:3-deoxy-D-manno-octulosonic acid transferase [Rhizomicrobium sp.]
MNARTPLPLAMYRAATRVLAPAARLVINARARAGKEDRSRLSERFGKASLSRPPGELIWMHGASVGECLSVLPLIDGLLHESERSVLLTSGTITSAELMRQRLPKRAFHQFAPVDSPSAVRRFLDHWRPDAGLFVDSELWPNLIASAHTRGVKLALVNGRMSARAYAGWRRAPKSARHLLSCFRACLAQDDLSAERFRLLGASDVRVSGNLKADAPPAPADANKMAALSRAIGARPVLLAASTHPGEDETVLPAHDVLRQNFPDVLTILVPRHPVRGSEIAMLCGTRTFKRRSENELPGSDTAVYIADTIGELAMFYRVARFAFIGGSLIPRGGQNPLEAAKLERAVMAGPHTDNFAGVYDTIFAAQAAGRVHSCAEIVALAERWFVDAEAARRAGCAAAGAAAALGGALEKTRAAIEQMLGHAGA